MRIAVVGGGISGLTVARGLAARGDCRVELIEADSRLGGHAHTVDVDDPLGPIAVDTGFIVFNDSTYPGFLALLAELGIEGRPTTMSFSVRDDAENLEYRGMDLAGLFAQRRNLIRPKFLALLNDFVRFRRAAERLDDQDERVTVAEFLARNRFSRTFVRSYFLPMGSAVWSCPCATFETFPVRFIIDFYRHHGMLGVQRRPQWRTVPGGSRTYVTALVERLDAEIRTSTPVERLRRLPDGVELFGRRPNEAAVTSLGRYDHVVLGCHADQSLRILGDQATSTEREVLSRFPYEANEVVLHTDTSVLPKRRGAWACWNYDVRESSDRKASVTYLMNRLQGFRAERHYCVTLNDDGRLAADKVLRRFEYHHPIFALGKRQAQRRHAELIDHDRVSYCGAYWAAGFHEDGVRSGLEVLAGLRRARVAC
ncbi:MAG TPA: FAD-dependent oxidoreductase [Planctomycetaceae bacterium]|nr:FAD-dependent oxidoreductase [Planctomycetaceae bacterium]